MFLLKRLVQLRLDWPVHLVDRLPDDFLLTLSGPDIPKQVKAKSAGSIDDDLVYFEFRWDDEAKDVKLEASGNGQTVVLWQEQTAGDLGAELKWDERLHPLLSEPDEVEVAGEETNSGTMPDDLKSYDLSSLFEELP